MFSSLPTAFTYGIRGNGVTDLPSGTLCQTQLWLPQDQPVSHGTLCLLEPSGVLRRAAQRPSGNRVTAASTGQRKESRGSSSCCQLCAWWGHAITTFLSLRQPVTVISHLGCTRRSLWSFASLSLPIATRSSTMEPSALYWCCLHNEPCPNAMEVGRFFLFPSSSVCLNSITLSVQQPLISSLSGRQHPWLVHRTWRKTRRRDLFAAGAVSQSQVATPWQSHILYQASSSRLGHQRWSLSPAGTGTDIHTLSPANQNLIVFGHVEGNFALLSHGWVLFFMSVALIQSYLSAKLHVKNKQRTTDTRCLSPSFHSTFRRTGSPRPDPLTAQVPLVASVLAAQGFTPSPVPPEQPLTPLPAPRGSPLPPAPAQRNQGLAVWIFTPKWKEAAGLLQPSCFCAPAAVLRVRQVYAEVWEQTAAPGQLLGLDSSWVSPMAECSCFFPSLLSFL